MSQGDRKRERRRWREERRRAEQAPAVAKKPEWLQQGRRAAYVVVFGLTLGILIIFWLIAREPHEEDAESGPAHVGSACSCPACPRHGDGRSTEHAPHDHTHHSGSEGGRP